LNKINQIQPWIDSQEASYLKKVVLKSFLTENKETEKFEKNIKKKFELKNCLAVNNWTSGIFMCLKIINIKPGDEVIVPNITFIATATPIIWLGAKIVLCDIDLNNFCFDLNKLKKLITPRTKCIIPVHLYGHCCDLDKLKRIINNRNIYVLEDAAQAIGAKYKDKFLGNIFDFGGYSFYGNKIITTGEGGVVIFRNKKFLKKLYALKNHGREVKGIFKHKNIGYNFMFTEMQAAVGNIQLRKLNKILNRKKKIYKFYKNKLSYIKEIKFMQAIKENTPVYWFSNIITKKKSKLKKYLNSQKIQTRDMFLPLNRQPCFKNTKYIKNINNKFINSEKIFRQGLSLPSSYNLNEKDLTYVVKKIKYFFKKKI